jgi:ribosomal protein S18 acetylase RimI-like enzyme
MEECEAVLELWRAADATPSATDYTSEVQRIVGQFPDAVLVAEHDDRIIGTIVAGWDGWRGSIYRLAVLPAHRRKGVGQALVLEAERRLRDKGAKRLSVLVEGHDDLAMAFWSSLLDIGYERDPRMFRFVKSL